MRVSCASVLCGTIWHFDGSKFTEVLSAPDRIFFGVWASGPNDVWVVDSTLNTTDADSTRGGVTDIYRLRASALCRS